MWSGRGRVLRGLRLAMALAAVSAYLVGCVSAEKLLDKGLVLEKQGRIREAAFSYVEALEKDPSLADAREHLQSAGQEAVDRDLAQSLELHKIARHTEAARLLLSVDELVAAAAGVDVLLQLPADYASRRRQSFDRAIDDLMERGGEAQGEGRWGDAISFYECVGEYEPSTRQRQSARAAHTETLILWAEDDLAAGRYRSALARADTAIERLGGSDAPEAEAAVDLWHRIVDAGTVVVAFTPVTAREEIEPPRYFLHELNEDLMVDRWSEPPVLVASGDPVLVRQVIRDRGLKDAPLSPVVAGEIARQLGADLAFVAKIDRFAEEERDKGKQRVQVQTRSGGKAEYLRFTADLHIRVDISFDVVDGRDGRVVASGKVRKEESGKIEWAEFDGDHRNLKVSREDFALFDSERYREKVEAIEAQLIPELAAGVSRKGYEAILDVVE